MVDSMEVMVVEGQEKVRREREEVEVHQQALRHRIQQRFGIPVPASRLGDLVVRCNSAPAGDWPAARAAAARKLHASQTLTPQQTPQQSPRQERPRSQGAVWNLLERTELPGPVSPITQKEKAEHRWEVLFGSSCPLKPRKSKGVPNIGTSTHWQGLLVGALWEPTPRVPRIGPVSAAVCGPEAATRQELIRRNTRSARTKSSKGTAESVSEEEGGG